MSDRVSIAIMATAAYLMKCAVMCIAYANMVEILYILMIIFQ